MEDSTEKPHPPVFSKQRKNTTHPKKPAKTNAIGSKQLSNLFDRPSTADDAKIDKVHGEESTSYAIKDHGESMELDDPLPSMGGNADLDRVQGEKNISHPIKDHGESMELDASPSTADDADADKVHGGKSTSNAIKDHGDGMELDASPSTAGDGNVDKVHGEDIEMGSGSSDHHDEQPDHLEGAIEDHGDTPAEDHSDDLPAAKVPRDYSNEARTYMARYEDLSILHDLGRHNECREGCLDLLTEPRIPLWTRIQTLQMVATLLPPAPAEDCLNKAAGVIEMMDPTSSMWQTRLLKGDNNKMLADLNGWRSKKGLIGMDLDGTEYGDIGGQPAAEYFELDRHRDYLAADEDEKAETATATANAGPSTPLVVRTKKDEQLPSPTSSPTEE